jgi:hypothetical protein
MWEGREAKEIINPFKRSRFWLVVRRFRKKIARITGNQ